MRNTSLFLPSKFTPLLILLGVALIVSPVNVEAQWWKFWKKRDSSTSAQTEQVESEAPIGRDLKDVESERKAAEKALKKERKKQLREAEDRQEELEKNRRESQKAIEKNQKKILADQKKHQRKVLRDLRAKNSQSTGKRSSFLQKYRYRKSSGDGFFLSQ